MYRIGKFLQTLCTVVGMVTLLYLGFAEADRALFGVWGYGADSSDAKDKRSGMAIHLDSKTGCHYLASPWGGLTPRLDGAGKHICND